MPTTARKTNARAIRNARVRKAFSRASREIALSPRAFLIARAYEVLKLLHPVLVPSAEQPVSITGCITLHDALPRSTRTARVRKAFARASRANALPTRAFLIARAYEVLKL